MWSILHFSCERDAVRMLFTLFIFFFVCCCYYYCCRYCYFELSSSSSAVVVVMVTAAVELWEHRVRITWSHSYSHWYSLEQTDLNHMHDKLALHPRIISLSLEEQQQLRKWLIPTSHKSTCTIKMRCCEVT